MLPNSYDLASNHKIKIGIKKSKILRNKEMDDLLDNIWIFK